MILVTGGAGFIGSTSFSTGWRTITSLSSISTLTYAGNIRNLDALADDNRHILCAWRYGRSRATSSAASRGHHPSRPKAMSTGHPWTRIFVQTNSVGTFRLLSCPRTYFAKLPDRDAFRFLLDGDVRRGRTIRHSTNRPASSPYSASKAAGDHRARLSPPTVFARPDRQHSNNYGPYHFRRS